MAEAFTDACSGSKLTDEWFGYDADGNLTDFYESTPNSGGYYHSVATYWANSAINGLSAKNSSASLIFPTIYYGTSTGAGLDGEGRYTKVYGSSGTNPVTGVTYTTSGTAEPIGSLTKTTYGSSDNDNFTYDTGTGRLKTYTFAINGVNDKGTLTWNTNGTLGKLVIADSLSGTSDSQTCNFYYDDLGRLGGNTSGHSVDCGSTKWQQLFTLDAFGNIVKSGSSNFAANYQFTVNNNPVFTNQIFSVIGASISYDSNGNLLTDNLNNTYTWDPNWGNPASVNSTKLIYDALGQMVEQQNGSAYTQILYSQVGKTAIMSGQTLTKAFVYLPGGGTAIYGSSGPTYYRHPDWLGSSRLTSTPSRGVYSTSSYAPYGEQYTPSGTVDASFTGQNADTNSTLYDFIFRENSPTQGRWISPDPAGLVAVNPTNPQSWNRYGYVYNNPLGFVDPQGLIPVYVCVTWTITYGSGSSASPGASGEDCSWQDDGTVDLPNTLTPGETPGPVVVGGGAANNLGQGPPKPPGPPAGATKVRTIDCALVKQVFTVCTYACTESTGATGAGIWPLSTIRKYPACSTVTSCPNFIFVEAVGNKASIVGCSKIN
jgi:RHS repeat-associated protein